MTATLELWCSLCSEPFDDKERVPILLDCAHSYCKLCLRTSHSRLKTCPTCRAQVTRSTSQQRPNYALIQALEAGVDAAGSTSGLSPYFSSHAVSYREILGSLDSKVLHSVLRKLAEAGHDVSR